MQITINFPENIGRQIRQLPDTDGFISTVVKQALDKQFRPEKEDIRKKVERAAYELLDCYQNDPELTAFTVLDSGDFYA